MNYDDEYVPCDSCSCCEAGRCNSRKGSDCGPTCPCTNG